MFLNPNYQNALNHLNKFIDNGLQNYAKDRNFDHGAHKRSNVSLLSPFIKKRILHEKEVILSALKNYKYTKIEKFIQEVFWRTYWKGWLEGRPEVWNYYLENLKKQKEQLENKNFKNDYYKAINGQTGIKCFDAWVNELTKYGYLHNHSRMWFASIWIFTLNIPWELGADFFYRNLLDADPASNTLSWRWVAGLHTQGKYYLAREENIEKFSNFSFKGQKQLKKNVNTPNYQFFEYKPIEFKTYEFEEVKYFLINPTNLNYNDSFIDKLKKKKVISFSFFFNDQDNKNKIQFDRLAYKEYLSFLEKNQIDVVELNNLKEFESLLNKSFSLFTPYPGIGYEKDNLEIIAKKSNIKIKYLYDSYDIKCWPYAKSGFFKFKSNIENIIQSFSNEKI